MNIWLLTSQFPPAPGGIARYVANAADMFAQAGHQVTVVAADQQDSDEELASGARLLRFAVQSPQAESNYTGAASRHPAFPTNILAYSPALSYQLTRQLSNLAKQTDIPDLIECQEYAALPYFLLQQRLLAEHPLSKTPVVVHLHSPDFVLARVNQQAAFQLPGYWTGRMEQFSILAADGLLCPSAYLAAQVARAVPMAAKADIIPYPYKPLTALPSYPQAGDLVFLGRLEARKGALALLEACERLWTAGLSFRLTMIGDDTPFAPRNMSMHDYLQRRFVRWIENGQLLFTGILPPAAVAERLASAWAVLIPSLWENYPNTCIEAMLLGKLVIGSTSGGQAEMIGNDGQAGLLFDWRVPGDCERVIQQALDMSLEQVQATGVQAQARIRALTSFESVLPQRKAHFERVIANFQPCTLFPSLTPEAQGRVLAIGPQETQGLLSVVVPFYNLGAYVAETLASIAASRYQPFEIIVIDDGSNPENQAALAQAAASYGKQLRIIRYENGGLARARNRGAEAAQGEFLAFVDADDLVEPDFFARAIAVLQRYTNLSMVYSWVQYFGASEDCWPTFNTEFPYLLGHNMLTAFVVMRRSHFLAFGRNDPEIAYALEDHESWIRMVAQGCIGVSIPEPLVRYRIRPESMLRAMNEEQGLYLMELIAERHPELYQRYGHALFALQNANGSALRWNHPAAAQIDFRARYLELLAAHERLLGLLGPLRPAVKTLRGLGQRLRRQ